MDLRFDFSLVLEKNLRSGDGLTAPLLRKGLRLAEKAALAVARRHAKGEIGFPDLPFLDREARALGGSALGTAPRMKNRTPAEIRIRGDD